MRAVSGYARETRLETFVCITICKDKHLPAISTRNDYAYGTKGAVAMAQSVFDSVPKEIFVEGYDAMAREIKFLILRRILREAFLYLSKAISNKKIVRVL